MSWSKRKIIPRNLKNAQMKSKSTSICIFYFTFHHWSRPILFFFCSDAGCYRIKILSEEQIHLISDQRLVQTQHTSKRSICVDSVLFFKLHGCIVRPVSLWQPKMLQVYPFLKMVSVILIVGALQLWKTECEGEKKSWKSRVIIMFCGQ